MSPAVDFLLYCTGCSSVLLSVALAARMLMSVRTRKPPAASPPARADNDTTTPAEHDLVGRLEAFQTQRYAPTLRRPVIDYTPGPGEPGGPRVIPPKLRAVPPPKGRTFSAPKQPQKAPTSPPKPETSNVVPLPVKMPRPDDTTKKD